MTTITPAEFMKGAAAPMNGSSPWASRYAAEIRRIVREHAEQSPRSLQVHLGPSELGVECDRQVVSKMLRIPRTNHVVDPWASIIGTAVHAWLARCFMEWNIRCGQARFVPETRVVPHTDHSGTSDLYDAAEQAVVDHKVLGETSMAKVRSPEGPPRHYQVQLLLYARGFTNLGLPVRRVALVAYPRTAASLDGLYVWSRDYTAEAEAEVDEALAQTERRRQMAALVESGHLAIDQIPAAPSDDACFFCPYFRPESARDNGPGCPGPRTGSK